MRGDENADYQHIALFPQYFQNHLCQSSTLVQNWIMWCRGKRKLLPTKLRQVTVGFIWVCDQQQFLTHFHAMTPFHAPGKQAF